MTFIIGEIGINHNGKLEIAKKIIKLAKDLGFDAVKFQKRNPDISTPENQKNKLRETPWGVIKYLDLLQYMALMLDQICYSYHI